MIAGLLETNDIRLREIPFEDKRDYLGLFEEVAFPYFQHFLYFYPSESTLFVPLQQNLHLLSAEPFV